LATDKKVKKIHLVYMNGVLEKKDKEDFKDLWAVLPHGDKVVYHSNIDFVPGP